MKFSLVLATIERTTELKRFLDSLDAQTYRDFELIVVDQNLDDRLTPILASYAGRWPLLHLRSPKGLSRARNIGLRRISGDLLCFPDDDCWYPPELLAQVAAFFGRFPQYDGYTGRAVNESGIAVGGRYDKQPGDISFYNAWNRAMSFAIFLRVSVFRSVEYFDESLGVGSGTRYGSAEETDYLIRAIQQGHALYYDPALFVFHPDPQLQYNQKLFQRGFLYGCGMGRAFKKHHYPLWFVAYNLARPFGGALLSLFRVNFQKSRFHWALLHGRLTGWLSK